VTNGEDPSPAFLRVWNRVGEAVFQNWIIGLGLVSYVGAAFLQPLFSPLYFFQSKLISVLWENLAGAGLSILTLAFLFFGAKDARELVKIRVENKRYRALLGGFGRDFFEVWSTQLAIWSKELGLDGRDRISIYKYSNGSFIMLGRYSENPALNGKGRGVYPHDQGCIGMAWSSDDGTSFVSDLPDPDDDLDGYVAAQIDKCQMPEGVVKGLTMKPRSIVALVVKDSADMRRQAIVVFESRVTDRFSGLGLTAFFGGARARQATLLMEAMSNQEPSIELAAREGF
jgi:hypothetical protein